MMVNYPCRSILIWSKHFKLIKSLLPKPPILSSKQHMPSLILKNRIEPNTRVRSKHLMNIKLKMSSNINSISGANSLLYLMSNLNGRTRTSSVLGRRLLFPSLISYKTNTKLKTDSQVCNVHQSIRKLLRI